MSAWTHTELRASLQEVIARSAQDLDERRFGEWLALTTPEFLYRITAYSPELRKDMTWLQHDRAGMAALIELLPKHHRDDSDWLRQVVLGNVTQHSDGSIHTISSVAIFRTVVDVGDTHVEGGRSGLFAVGRYHDVFRWQGEQWLLSERTVKLQTRQLGIGSHVFP